MFARLLPCIVLMSVSYFAAIPVIGAELELREDDNVIRVTLRGKPVLEYVKTEKPVPERISQHFRRSGYIHPVYSPKGQEVTGDFPSDHAHQHALFFAWTRSTFDGKKVDFWNQAKQLAGVGFQEVVNVRREEKQVAFSVKHAFTVGTGDERVDALYEIWTVTVHLTPDDHFLFDIESVQQCASEKPLILEKYHYGGMALRGNIEWLKEKGDHSIKPGDLRFLTSDGKDRWDGNHTRPNWVAMSGSLDGRETTIAVMCNPKNFRFPQPVRLHPNKPYFCFSPMVTAPFKIEPGQKYVSRYRYLVTSEAADPKIINRHWRRFAKGGE